MSEAGPDRAQTLPDFVVGVAIFLIAVGFVFAFLPQMTTPYQDQEEAAVAERSASDLSQSLLAEPGAAGLDEACTVAFFDGSVEPGCSFDGTDPLEEQLGISSRYSVNVTLEESASGGPGSETLCGDEGEIGSCGSERLALGPSVPGDGRSVASARQAVHVDGDDAVLEVSVWT